MSFAASAGRRRWILDSIAVYVDDQAVALEIAEAVRRNADTAERMGVFQLENGNRVAWVRFEERDDSPRNHHEGGAP